MEGFKLEDMREGHRNDEDWKCMPTCDTKGLERNGRTLKAVLVMGFVRKKKHQSEKVKNFLMWCQCSVSFLFLKNVSPFCS